MCPELEEDGDCAMDDTYDAYMERLRADISTDECPCSYCGEGKEGDHYGCQKENMVWMDFCDEDGEG